MHRQPLLNLLAQYEDRHPSEAEVVSRIRQLVINHADCFERTCRPGHITAAAWILSPLHDRVLLTHHRKLDRWIQLGGHADGRAEVEQVALREAQEESGMEHLEFWPPHDEHLPLDIDVHQIPELRDADGCLIEDAHEHHDIRFLLVAQPNQQLRICHESQDLRWFTPKEILHLTDEESVLRMLHKANTLLIAKS